MNRKAVVYHSGKLPADRLIDPALDRLANSALAAAIEGAIVLVQKRTSEGSYEYRAIHAAVAA